MDKKHIEDMDIVEFAEFVFGEKLYDYQKQILRALDSDPIIYIPPREMGITWGRAVKRGYEAVKRGMSFDSISIDEDRGLMGHVTDFPKPDEDKRE